MNNIVVLIVEQLTVVIAHSANLASPDVEVLVKLYINLAENPARLEVSHVKLEEKIQKRLFANLVEAFANLAEPDVTEETVANKFDNNFNSKKYYLTI